MATYLNNQPNNLFYPNYEKVKKLTYYSIWGLAVIILK